MKGEQGQGDDDKRRAFYLHLLSLLCAGIAAGLVYISNHAADAEIAPWAAAVLGGIAAIIPRIERQR